MSSDNPGEQGAFGAPGGPYSGGDPTTPIPPPPAGGYAYQQNPPGSGGMQAAGGGGAYGSPGTRGGDNVGFLTALFDFSFTHFVTPKLVRVVYILVTILLGLVYLFYVVAAMSASFSLGLIVLVGGALAFLIYLALARMSLEFFLALVRMSEDIHKRLPAG